MYYTTNVRPFIGLYFHFFSLFCFAQHEMKFLSFFSTFLRQPIFQEHYSRQSARDILKSTFVMLCCCPKKNTNLHTDKKGTKAYTIHDWNEKNSFLNLRDACYFFFYASACYCFHYVCIIPLFTCSPSLFLFSFFLFKKKVREIPQSYGHKLISHSRIYD